MKLLKVLLMLVIGVIILLHSLIPHTHYDGAQDMAILHSHNHQTELINNLQLTFGLNHGNGHFEHYLELEDFVLAIPFSATGIVVHPNGEVRLNPFVKEIFATTTALRVDRLRGPPVA